MGRLELLLNEILAELQYSNRKLREQDERLKSLESKDEVLRPMEAAKFLGVTHRTLTNYRNKGYVKEVVRGCVRGYLKSELLNIKQL